MVENSQFWTLILTVIGILGSNVAFRYYEKRAVRKERNEDYIKDECIRRISKLENELEQSRKEKEKLNELVLELSKEVERLKAKIELYEKSE